MNLGCAGTDSACRGNSRKRIRGNEKKKKQEEEEADLLLEAR